MTTSRAGMMIGELGALIGLPDLSFDADGDCGLTVDDTLSVDISHLPAEDAFLFGADLGRPAEPLDPALAAAMLDANFFWRGTAGATLGLDRESGAAVLIETVPLAGADAAGLHARLRAFVETARTWSDRIAGRIALSEEPVTTVTEAPAGDVILMP